VTGASALYVGGVFHTRLRPRRHRLKYRVFWLMLDLDEIDALDRRLKTFSRGRFNLMGFYDRDHGDGSGAPLRGQIVARLAEAGIEVGSGAIRLLTMPRVLGFVFNPISLYYCHRADGRLAAMVYEVTSTFGERRSYVLPVPAAEVDDDRFRQQTDKRLYVSPFMGMEMDYVFRGRPPGETLTYGEIAVMLGDRLLAQAVGKALGANPWPIVVPCHRITAAGGKLGGFSARGGQQTKLRLLAIEGARAAAQGDLFG